MIDFVISFSFEIEFNINANFGNLLLGGFMHGKHGITLHGVNGYVNKDSSSTTIFSEGMYFPMKSRHLIP